MSRGAERRHHLRAAGKTDLELFHLTSAANLDSIMTFGLKPKSRMIAGSFVDISLESVQERRKERVVEVSTDRAIPLHDMVPFFYTWSTPMLYKRQRDMNALCFVVVRARDLCSVQFDVAFSDGNAAVQQTIVKYDFADFKTTVPWSAFEPQYWEDKRARSAEFLVAPEVPPELIRRIEVPNAQAAGTLMSIDHRRIDPVLVHVAPRHFFSPR